MSTAIESGIGGVNYGKQTAKGTIATAATTTVGYDKPKLADGQLSAKSITGSEEYVDGNRFGSPTNYVDTVGGLVGTLTIQPQPENAALNFAQILGVDTVTGSSDPYTHTITSAGTSGAWGTWWQKVGASVGPMRHLYSDSKTAKLMWVCGDKQRVAHQALDIMSCNPSQVFETDPAKTENPSDPFYFVDTAGAIEFDGVNLPEVNEETLEIDTGLEPFYGNSQTPIHLIEKKGTIVSTVKTIVTSATVPLFNKAIFGEASPALGAKPTKLVYYAVLKTVYTKSSTRKLTIERPRVAVKADEMAVGPQKEGGPMDIAFGGQCLKEGATPALTIIGLTGDATAY